MIDPWKFNPVSDLGKKASNLPEILYLKESLEKIPKIIERVKETRTKIKNGEKTLIENSNELFL